MATTIEDIQIEKIRANPANLRDPDFADDPEMENLTREVKALGVRVHLLVYPHPDIDGDFVVQDGHRRRIAAIRAGLSTVPCAVGSPPKRGEIEDVDVMLTTGRNGKSLSEAAVNRGVQRLLDLGNDVTTIGKKHSMSRTEIKTRSKLTTAPAAIKKRFESGALDLLAVQKIQELEEKGAEGLLDTVIEQLDDNSNATSRNPNMLNNTLERAKSAHATKQELARLVEMGAVEAPNDANYSGKYTRSRKELTTEEHVANSHEYTRGKYSEETTWYIKNKGTKVEPASDKEKADKQKQRAFNGLLSIAFRVRRTFLAEVCRAKDGGTGEAADFAMLFDLLWGDINRLEVPFLEELTGIVKPEDAVQYSNDGKYSVWEKKVEARIRSYSWRQLARLATLYRSKDTDKQLRFAKNFDRSGNHGEFDWSARAQWLRKVQDLFGYQLDEVEVQALEWGKEKAGTKRNPGNDVDTVTDACRDCRQPVVGGDGWDGRCGDCADRVEAAAGGGE